MPYEIKIKDVDTSETCKTTIEDLKELRELLKPYETKTIEVDVINTEVHKVKSKIRSDVKWIIYKMFQIVNKRWNKWVKKK